MNFPVPEHPAWYIYDSTKIQDYLDCPREYFYKRILGWERETPWTNDLQFGKAWHKAMEILYHGGFGNENILKAYEEGFLPTYREVFPASTDCLFDPKTPDNALLALSAYCVYPGNSRDLDLLDVIKTELAGVVPLDNDVSIVYKMDLLYRRKDNGAFGVLEHKSKKNGFTRGWTDQWMHSVQVGNYYHALCVMLGNEDLSNIDGVCVNGAAILKTKCDFARIPITKSKDMMIDHVWTVREIVDRMKTDLEFLSECSPDDRVMMTFPKNPQSCTKYYGCEFRDYCAAWPNPLRRCDSPPPGYIVRHWDPLAEEQATERLDLGLKEYV